MSNTAACLDRAGDNMAALRHAVEETAVAAGVPAAEHLAAQLRRRAEATARAVTRVGQVRHRKLRLAGQRKRAQHQDGVAAT